MGALSQVSHVDGKRPAETRSQWRAAADLANRKKLRKIALTCSFFGVSDGIRTHDIQDHN
jgi:hypothetical protein